MNLYMYSYGDHAVDLILYDLNSPAIYEIDANTRFLTDLYGSYSKQRFKELVLKLTGESSNSAVFRGL